MNSAQAVSGERRRWWVLPAAVLVLPLMISNGSLWIDEGATAIQALQPSFSAWWDYLNHDMGGDAQQPLGMFFSWLAGRLVGTSEWQLRSVNLLWGVVSLCCLWRVGQNIDVKWLPLLFVIQPFFWFYTNEARPYALQNACGAALLLAFTVFLRDKARGWRWCSLFTVAAVTLFYITALAPVFLISLALTAAFVGWQRRWKLEFKVLILLIVGLVASAPVALYYVQTLRRGVKGAQLWNVDARYLGYVAYDLAGASGLGPPTDQLRLLGRNVMQLMADKQMLLQLSCAISLLLCIGIVFLALSVSRNAGERRKLALILAGPLLLQIAIFFCIGLALHKNFWPRHLNVGFPFYVAALGVAIHWSLRTGNLFLKGSSVLLISMLFFSSLRLRYSQVYAKEDYRWATAAALQASRQGHVVWWVANKFAANYYGLRLVLSSPGSEEAFSPYEARWNGTPSELPAQPLPDDIFVSRSDVHDPSGAVPILIRENRYHLQAIHPSFEWWIR